MSCLTVELYDLFIIIHVGSVDMRSKLINEQETNAGNTATEIRFLHSFLNKNQ